jgi:hypothetical protein
MEPRASLVASFIKAMNASGLPKSRPTQDWQEFEICFIDLRRLKLNVGPFVPFLMRRLEDASEGDDAEPSLPHVIQYCRETPQSTLAVYVTGSTRSSSRDSLQLRQHSIAVLARDVLQAFTAAADVNERYRILGTALANSVGLSALSPYISGKPASGGRFFGRSRALDQIFSGRVIRNCTVLGNRRIGKTSLLYEVRERLSQLYVPGKSIAFADIYANKCKSTWDMVYLILSQLGVSVPKSYTKLGAIAPRFINRFPQLLREHSMRNGIRLVILIDDFDSFCEIDMRNGSEFLHLLREAAADDATCSVIITGFRVLMQTRLRKDSPFFNFTNEVLLTSLSREETYEMVTVPLVRLGLDVSSNNLVSVIYSETRGQPELVQIYCQAIISFYETHLSLPSETELVTLVNSDFAFNRAVLHTFLNNTNAWEQALCFALMKQAVSDNEDVANFKFRMSDARDLLRDIEISLSDAEIGTLMSNLLGGSILQRVPLAPGSYQFAVPQLIRFCQEINIDRMLANAREKLAQGATVFDTLALEIPAGPTSPAEEMRSRIREYLAATGRKAADELELTLVRETAGNSSALAILGSHLKTESLLSSSDVDFAVQSVVRRAAEYPELLRPVWLYLLDDDVRERADAILNGRRAYWPYPLSDGQEYRLGPLIARSMSKELFFRHGLMAKVVAAVRDRVAGDQVALDNGLLLVREIGHSASACRDVRSIIGQVSDAWLAIGKSSAHVDLAVQSVSQSHGFVLDGIKCLAEEFKRNPNALAESQISRQPKGWVLETDLQSGAVNVTVRVWLEGQIAPPRLTADVLWLWTVFLRSISSECVSLACAEMAQHLLTSPRAGLPKRVFVSSTYLDLAEHRKAVIDEILRRDLLFRGMEHFGASPDNLAPAEKIVQEVRAADVYLGIFGVRYGSTDPATGLSMTEVELNAAESAGKPMLLYVIREDAPVKKSDWDTDMQKRARLEALIARLKQKYVVHGFIDAADLAKRVYEDLGKL